MGQQKVASDFWERQNSLPCQEFVILWTAESQNDPSDF